MSRFEPWNRWCLAGYIAGGLFRVATPKRELHGSKFGNCPKSAAQVPVCHLIKKRGGDIFIAVPTFDGCRLDQPLRSGCTRTCLCSLGEERCQQFGTG